MKYLLLRTRGRFYHRQYVVPSFFDNIDCNKRGQTSRVVVGVQVPEGCDSKEILYNCSCYLGFVPRWFSQLFLCFHNCVSLCNNLNFFLHKNFSLAASLQDSCPWTRLSKSTKPSYSTQRRSLQKRSPQRTLGAGSIDYLLSASFYSRIFNASKRFDFISLPGRAIYSDFSVVKFFLKPVAVLLEDQRSKASCERHSQATFLFLGLA